MKKIFTICICTLAIALLLSGFAYFLKKFTERPGDTVVIPTLTLTPLPTPTLSPTPIPTETPTPEPTPTEELTPTEEPTPEPTEEPTPTEEPLPTDSPTPVPTNTATPEPTKEPTKVPTKEPTKAPTNTPTNSPTPTNTPTPTEVVQEQPYKAWIKTGEVEIYEPQLGLFLTPITGHGLQKGSEVTVIKTNANGASSTNDMLSEIRYSGGTAYIWANDLSKTYIEPRWSEPRERKDIAEALMAMVQNYRAQNGKRKLEDPRVYYDVTNSTNVYNYLTTHGITVAKRCCMEYSSNHEGGQIATGIYGNVYQSPMNANECAMILFNSWKGSPAHNASMLRDSDDEVPVGVMTVVEWYDGTGYQYCAVLSHTAIYKGNLPDGLQ